MMQFGNQREEEMREDGSRQEVHAGAAPFAVQPGTPESRLAQWPCQIKLVPEQSS